MEYKSVSQNEALQFFNHTLRDFSNSNKFKKIDGPSVVSSKLQDCVKILKIKHKELQEEYDEINKGINVDSSEHQTLDELLQKQLMIVSQLEKNLHTKAEEAKVSLACQELYKQRLRKASSNASSKDIQLLDTYKKKLEAYKKLTGVYWEFPSCNERILSGYIRDQTDHKLKMFHLDIAGKSRDDIVSEIWNIVEKKSVCNNNILSL